MEFTFPWSFEWEICNSKLLAGISWKLFKVRNKKLFINKVENVSIFTIPTINTLFSLYFFPFPLFQVLNICVMHFCAHLYLRICYSLSTFNWLKVVLFSKVTHLQPWFWCATRSSTRPATRTEGTSRKASITASGTTRWLLSTRSSILSRLDSFYFTNKNSHYCLFLAKIRSGVSKIFSLLSPEEKLTICPRLSKSES